MSVHNSFCTPANTIPGALGAYDNTVPTTNEVPIAGAAGTPAIRATNSAIVKLNARFKNENLFLMVLLKF